MSEQSSADRQVRPTKSYLERYHDIKNMLNDDHGAAGNKTFSSTSSSYSNRDGSISLSNTDNESFKTLERWESRKERKRAEDPSFPDRDNSAPTVNSYTNNGRYDRATTSNISRTGNRGSRWTPPTNYNSYDSPDLNTRKTPSSPLGDSSPLFSDVELSPNEGTLDVNPLSTHAHFATNTTNAHQKKNSRYADDLRSFCNGISKSVAKDMAKEYWSQPPAYFDKEDTRNEEVKERYRPDPESCYENGKESEGEERYIGRRIRMGASSCCNSFSCKNAADDEDWDDPFSTEFTPTWSSGYKRKKWHIFATVLFCVGCVIATAFTVQYVSSEKRASYASSMTLRPTISHMPSSSPSEMPSSFPSEIPTNRPTDIRDRLISEYLSEITDGVSNVEDTPQFRAKIWLLYEDRLNLSLPTYGSEELKHAAKERVKQRYALATLFYSMKIGEGGVLKGWLEGDECKFVGDYDKAWDGVDCDDEREVRALAIDGANISGSIPSQISLLHKMQNLIIKNNPNLEGKIPNSIGDMTELKQIALYNNKLKGTLPQSILQLPSLVYLNAADNMLMGEINWDGVAFQRNLARLILQNNFFEGSIPFHTLTGSKLQLLGLSNNNFRGFIDSRIGDMEGLEYLYLDRNKLAGQLPDSLGNLTNLVSLNLDENEFDGPLPSTIGRLSKLNYLSARGNKLSGGLPIDTRQLTSLQTLNLANNALSGNIQSLIGIPKLEHVHLYQNSFTGDIPTALFNAQSLKILFLSSNSLTGNIPNEVSRARKLKGLYLSDNKLSGDIPNSACSLTNLEDLFIDSNTFSGSLPPCFGNLSKLKRLYAFKNQLTGNVPSSILELPNLVELGIEENDISGGIDEICMADFDGSLDIWADCDKLQGGCDCCKKCCSDMHSQCD